jgi:hypothetical protein
MIVRRIWHGWRFRGVDSLRRTTATTTARPPPAVQIGQMTTPFDYDRNPERFRRRPG